MGAYPLLKAVTGLAYYGVAVQKSVSAAQGQSSHFKLWVVYVGWSIVATSGFATARLRRLVDVRRASRAARGRGSGEWRRVQRSTGYRSIIVNGVETFADGDCRGATPGKLLRHGHA
jgi:hypothetical protein